jgi:hypothetical protein
MFHASIALLHRESGRTWFATLNLDVSLVFCRLRQLGLLRRHLLFLSADRRPLAGYPVISRMDSGDAAAVQ